MNKLLFFFFLHFCLLNFVFSEQIQLLVEKAFPLPSSNIDSITVKNAQEIFLCDMKSSVIYIFNSVSGVITGKFGKIGKNLGELDFPSDLCIHPEGYIFVADSHNNRIMVYSKDFKGLSTVTGIQKPSSLCVINQDRILCSEFEKGKIYSVDSQLQRRIFCVMDDNPNSITWDGKNRIFVSSWNTSKVSVFNDKGNLIGTIKPREEFRKISALAFWKNYLICCDYGGSKIRIMDIKTGETKAESTVRSFYESDCNYPLDVDVWQENIFVVDSVKKKLVMFRGLISGNDNEMKNLTFEEEGEFSKIEYQSEPEFTNYGYIPYISGQTHEIHETTSEIRHEKREFELFIENIVYVNNFYELSVVVVDEKCNPVMNLRKEDFQVYMNEDRVKNYEFSEKTEKNHLYQLKFKGLMRSNCPFKIELIKDNFVIKDTFIY